MKYISFINKYFKLFLRPLLIDFPKWYISRLGFINYYKYYVNGNLNRLIIKGKYEEPDFANTIFNTRSGKIVLEKNVFFSQNVMILTGKHNYTNMNPEVLKNEIIQNRDIYICEGVWLASGCIILGDVRIGKNSIVMASAVVTKDVPENCIVGGIPAKIIKRLDK